MRAINGSVTRKSGNEMQKRVEGSWGTRHTSFKIASQTFIQSNNCMQTCRHCKKRDFRKQWIASINAVFRPLDITYLKLMNNLKKQNISINHKILSELAINQPKEFEKVVKQVQGK